MDCAFEFEFAEKETKGSKHVWSLNSPSEISLQTNSLQRFTHNQHLQLFSHKVISSHPPSFPATSLERLFFYHTYTSSLSKIIMMIRERHEFNKFIWFYVLNVFCKTLPSAYAHMFLGSYAPDYHYFIPKIFPFMYGCNWIFCLTAITELLLMTNYTLFCLDYAVCGLWYKVPWNRCSVENNRKVFYNCVNIHEFKQKFLNTTVTKYHFEYISSLNDEHFILVQFDYYFERFYYFWHSNKGVFVTLSFVALIWVYNVFQFYHINKTYVWRLLGKAHIMYNLMLSCMLIHCLLNYTTSNINKVKIVNAGLRQSFINIDYNMLAESMTVLPVAHVLSAEGGMDIRPNRDSAIMITSNALNYFFKCLITILVRIYCENKVNAPLYLMDNVDIDQVFNIWPTYFALLEYGDIYVVFFYFLSFLTELCTLIVSSQCFLQTVANEWNRIEPYKVALIIFFTNVFFKLVIRPGGLVAITFYCKTLCTLVEAVVLFWMYPLERLEEDMKFHCGYSLTKLRVLSFQIVPIYYFFKMYISLCILDTKNRVKFIEITQETFFLLPLVPFAFGVLYAAYHYIIKRGKSWTQLFKPVPEWGPRDIDMRSLRKQFDSRNYIGSQAPRKLARHLIEKLQPPMYNLGIYYDDTTNYASPIYFGNAKKFT